MASDGLLMNFEVTEAPAVFRPSVKGGHWKDRRNVKRRLQDRQKVRNEGPREETVVEGPPSKRVRIEQSEGGKGAQSSDQREPLASKHRLNPHDRSSGKHLKNAQGRSNEVISSIFTYNPVAKPATKEVHEQPEQNAAPSNAPLPEGIDSFLSLGLSPTLATHLMTKLEVKDPTAVQKESIPRLLQENSDTFIQAQTGSGKTLAYLLPLVQKLTNLANDMESSAARIDRHSGMFAIILAPTRELAKQISVVLEKLLRCAHWLVAGTVIGGEKKKSEKARLRKGLNILVATPGRLVDHLSHTDVLDVSQVRWLILDEGDRLMELGFEQDIKAIVDKLETAFRQPKGAGLSFPTRRTTILCSATMKTNVQRLGEMSLKDAVHIRIDARDDGGAEDSDEKFSAPAQLKQSYILVPPKQRLVTLHALLRHTFARKGSVMKAIVFLSCADSVEFHFAALSRATEASPTDGTPLITTTATAATTATTTIAPALHLTIPPNPVLQLHKLHGSLPQAIRSSTLAAFARATDPCILICTDVAARGLDLPSVDLVVEYDPAFSADDHLHRIGRTARAGRDGRAIVFLMPGAEEGYVAVLKSSYRAQGAHITRQDAVDVMKKALTPAGSVRAKHAWEEVATNFQLDVERWILADERVHELARKAFVSHVRAYATHVVSERGMFDIKDLHLGHLAKAFGLREPPGNMGRGATAGKSRKAGRGRADGDRRGDGRGKVDVDGRGKAEGKPDADRNDWRGADEAEDRDEARRKMRRAMKVHMSAAGEFNIG